MDQLAGLFDRLRASPRRALLIEAAFLVPDFGLLALGSFEWGGYFWLQHKVQTAADGARVAAAASADPARRNTLARAAAEKLLSGQVADLDLKSGPDGTRVRLAYDASASPIFALGHLVPLPPPMIVRLSGGD